MSCSGIYASFSPEKSVHIELEQDLSGSGWEFVFVQLAQKVFYCRGDTLVVQIVIAQQDFEKLVERFEVALISFIGITLMLIDVTCCFEQRCNK